MVLKNFLKATKKDIPNNKIFLLPDLLNKYAGNPKTIVDIPLRPL